MDDENLAKRLGTRARELRKDRGLKLHEVAERSGLSLSRIAYVENGKRELSVGALVRLARALGVAPNDLIGEPTPNDPISGLMERLPDDPVEVRRRIQSALRALDGG